MTDDHLSDWARDARRFAVISGAVSIVVFLLVASRAELRFLPSERGLDSWHYTRMAEGFPKDWVDPPFRNRLFIPTVVQVLPLPTQWGFAVVTSLLLGVSFAGIDQLLRRWFTPRMALVGLALLASVGSLTNLVEQPFYVDAAVLAAAVFVLLCLERGWWLALVVLMPVAVASHDLTLLLLVPIGLTAWRAKKLPDAAVIGVVSIGTWWFLHRSGILVPTNTRANMLDASYRSAMIDWNLQKYRTFPGAVWAHLVFGVGVLGLLAPFGVKRGPQVARDSLWMLPICCVLCLTASDWGRLLLPVLPALTVLACATIAAASSGRAEEPGRGDLGRAMHRKSGTVVEVDAATHRDLTDDR